jgi:hypothetical protein
LHRYIQTQGLKKDKWRTALVEMLSVVTFTKPGVDAYRVASGAAQLAGAAFDPLAEMMYTKGGELVFEAVPGCACERSAIARIIRLLTLCLLQQTHPPTRGPVLGQGKGEVGLRLHPDLHGIYRPDGDHHVLGQ